MNRIRLTKRAVESADPGGKRLTLHDTELKGFQCRVSPAGTKIYYLYYRTTDGRERRPKIGVHGAVTAEEARAIARRWLAEVADGKDPSLSRQTMRRGEIMKDFAKRYMKHYAKVRKKASSAAADEMNLNVHVIPRLGSLRVSDVTRRDVLRLHQAMRDKPYAANRVLALLSKMFNLAEQWGERPQYSNPCRHVDKYKERKRERFLSAAELNALSKALQEAEHRKTELQSAVDAIRLLLFTGCRRDEILTLKWDYMDLEASCLRLPDSKTGQKKVYLTAPALAVLADVERQPGNPYVIAGARKGQRLVNLRKPWLRIRERATLALWRAQEGPARVMAGLGAALDAACAVDVVQAACARENVPLRGGLLDVRLHDLRHTFASVAAGGGQPLPIIGKLLGHTQAQTTARYAHLADDPVRRAAETVAADLRAAMEGTAGNIVKLPRGQK